MTSKKSFPYVITAASQRTQDRISRHFLRTALIAFALLFMGGVSWAQLYTEDAAIAQALFSKTKRVFVSNYMNIDDSPGNATFWRLYDEYEAKRKAIFLERFYLFKEYTDNYVILDDVMAANLAEGFMDNSAKIDKLNKHYFKKFRKQVGGLRAATLFQIEVYTQTALQNDAHMQVPIIGELEKIQKEGVSYRF